VDRLLIDGHRVRVADDLSSGNLANLADARQAEGDLTFDHLDVAGPEGESWIARHRPEVIVHLAAVPRRITRSAELAAAWTRTLALLDAARRNGAPKVVVALPASVISGNPRAKDLPLKEGDLQPRGAAGILARAVIDTLEHARARHAVEFTALALGTVYGPRQRPNDGVVAGLVAAATAGRPAAITGDGKQSRDLIHVDDVVEALAAATRRGDGLTINVGTGQATRVLDLWELIAPDGPAPRMTPARPDELARLALSPARARIHLDWSPFTPRSHARDRLRGRFARSARGRGSPQRAATRPRDPT
jgi:UDP-glucose 4-epimerase